MPPTDTEPVPLGSFLDDARAFLDGSSRSLARGAAGDPGSTEDRKALFRGSTIEEADAAKQWQQQVFDAGFGWITGPVELGGRGLSGEYERAYLQLERTYNVPSRGALTVGLGIVAPTIVQFGTERARLRWPRALRRADAVGCQLFSEPDAGSDLAAVSTTATRDDAAGGWRLSGQKVWTSGAHYSDVGLTLTRTARGPRHRDLSVFLVDMHQPGLEVRPLRQMTGGADFNEVYLDGAFVPDEHLVGNIGEGWHVALTSLMYERGAIGGTSTGGAGLFRMDSLVEWLRELGRSDDPVVVQAFARLYSGVAIAKATRARVEASARAGRAPGPEISLSKLALTANLVALSDLASAALGPRLAADSGQPGTFSWAEFVLGVPGMRIGGGTDEVQRNTIAERVLGLPKEPSIDH